MSILTYQHDTPSFLLFTFPSIAFLSLLTFLSAPSFLPVYPSLILHLHIHPPQYQVLSIPPSPSFSTYFLCFFVLPDLLPTLNFCLSIVTSPSTFVPSIAISSFHFSVLFLALYSLINSCPLLSLSFYPNSTVYFHFFYLQSCCSLSPPSLSSIFSRVFIPSIFNYSPPCLLPSM